jgi:3-oxoacyl-[acyl-carrier-protein] synthase-3
MKIGITAFATYIPGRVQTSAYLARATGIPQDVLEQKFGIKQKPWAAEGEQVSEMAVKAARRVLDGQDPRQIDLVLWTGSEHKDFPIWSAGIKVQHEIGAVRAWSADVAARCATTQLGLKFARDVISADDEVRKVLLVGGHRMNDVLNYQNPRARFLINMSDAASAVLVERDSPRNEILHTAIMTDGSFSEDVVVPGGGTRLPLTRENFDPALLCLDCPNPEQMKVRLDQVSLPNFLTVVERAVTKSGYRVRDIGYLAIIHMKRSAHAMILRKLGLREDQTTYLEEFGHAGAPDVVRSLELGVRDGKIRDGDLVVLAGAGTGYIWAATCIRWGPTREG